MPFLLRICKPLNPSNPVLVPTAYLDIDPDITSLQWTTTNPGGYGALNVGMQASLTDSAGPDYVRLQTPVHLPPRAHVELYAGSTKVFEGAVMVLNKNSSGQADGFIAEGYGTVGTNDDYIESTEGVFKTSGTILREVLTQYAPLINFGPSWNNPLNDPGTLHQKAEFNALFPADVIDRILREGGTAIAGQTSNAGGASGDTSNGVWDWLVYENRLCTFQPRIPPAGTALDPIDYHIPFDDRITAWVEDYHKLVGQVGIRYSNLDAGGNSTALTPRYPACGTPLYTLFGNTYGFHRSAVIEGGKMHARSAITYATNFIALRAQPSYAVRIIRAQQQGMERQGMVDMPPYLVRAGEWVQVGDANDNIVLPIVTTAYDAYSEVLQLDMGDALPHGLNDNRTLHRIAAHVLRGTNPTTGARI